MGKGVVCLRCEDLVQADRKSGAGQLLGLGLVIFGLFAFWPLIVVGVLMMVFGSAKRLCPNCKSDQLVPSGTPAGMRIMEARLARLSDKRAELFGVKALK